MANEEQLAILKEGVEAWNQWRQNNLVVEPDLSNADLSLTNLSNADLSHTSLSRANLSFSSLISTNLSHATLISADLSGANLSSANLNRANLSSANLSSADLSYVNLSYTDLSRADLSRANLIFATLSRTQALKAYFQYADLTGSCIQDWSINSDTNLEGVICEYVFLSNSRSVFQERRPSDPEKIFAPGEFVTLIQKSLSTVDLIFTDGIDWKAFFASFQDLQQQYAYDDLTIQAIERKGGAFVVRLEVSPNADKGAIERDALQKYEAKLQLLETQYHAELNAKDREIESYKREGANMMEIARLLASRPINVEARAEAVANHQSKSTNYDLRNSKFGGGFAAEGGTQSGGTFNDYSIAIGQNIDDITRLIASLRAIAKAFPDEQSQEAQHHLDDLETDLKSPDPQPNKIQRRLDALKKLATGIGLAAGFVAGTVTSTNEFMDELTQLAEKLNLPLPIEQIQVPKAQHLPSIDTSAIEPSE